jgi:hypothetical protein
MNTWFGFFLITLIFKVYFRRGVAASMAGKWDVQAVKVLIF